MMKRVVLIVIAVTIAAGIFGWVRVHAPVPEKSGTVHVPSLARPVTVYFDAYGVPHGFADSLEDGSYVAGYLQASERLFQMDLGRRNASGRLAELFGEQLVERDRFRRVLGLHRVAEKSWETLSPELQQSLTRFADGVNEYVATNPDKLPLEYALAGIEFEPWKPTDSLVMGLEMGYLLGANWRHELMRWVIAHERGEDIAYQIIPRHIDDGPYIIPPSMKRYTPLPTASRAPAPEMPHFERNSQDVNDALLQLLALDRDAVGRGFASNSWIIAGRHTASGKPILANDPHLELGLPSIWLEGHLVAPGVDATGVMFPGSPLVVLGHTRSTAWGATTTMADTQDIYIERVNPDNPGEYEYNGAYEPFRTITETIRFKDGDGYGEEHVVIKFSRHGPIINSASHALQGQDAPPMALRWILYEYPPDLSALFDMVRATSWNEFRAALEKLHAPVQNWVYADVNGDIGYIAAGYFPIRAPGHDGAAPVPGWTDEYEWRGIIPTDDLPQVVNPERGFVVTANNKVVPPEDYPYIVSRHYAAPYRAARITALIEEAIHKGPVTLDTVQSIQNDVKTLQAERLVPIFVEAVRKSAQTDLQREAIRRLEQWDFVASPDSVACTIFHQMRHEVVPLIFNDEVSAEAVRDFLGWQSNAVDNVLAGDSSLYDDRRTPDHVETREDILVRAFNTALGALEARLGSDMATWTWGRVHTKTFVHPIAMGVEQMGALLNVGPFPHPGSRETVNDATWYDEPFSVVAGPSMRHVIDMADVENARITNTLGQSGHRMSDHYADQVEDWRAGRYHAMPMSRDAVERAAESMMVFTPH